MTKAGYTDYTVADVPAESWIMTLLPYLLVFGAMFILFAVMNNNAAAQGGGGKMMITSARTVRSSPHRRRTISSFPM